MGERDGTTAYGQKRVAAARGKTAMYREMVWSIRNRTDMPDIGEYLSRKIQSCQDQLDKVDVIYHAAIRSELNALLDLRTEHYEG